MDENKVNSNLIASINLSRNTPVALVVGAAGFIGSFLSEKLLDHKITVIGVDNFKNGTRENLSECTKNSHFHLIAESAEDLKLDLPRLDYIFIVAGQDYRLNNILSLSREYKSKIIFISWINLYDHKSSLIWFKKTEGEIAQFAKDHSLNARVLRLSATFGPRMNFRVEDPIVDLIVAALKDNLQEEDLTLEFSTRAIYIDDTVNLIIKSMLSGSTAWKIFDGANPIPVKVSEVKQILLDPIWHENRGFTPSELPPWSTPNLERTIKELHWHPKKGLVEALKETLKYFKDHEFKIPEKTLVEHVEHKVEEKIATEEVGFKVKYPKVQWGKLIILALFFYSFIYPLMTASLGLSFLNYKVSGIVKNYQKGELDRVLVDISNTKIIFSQVADALDPFIGLGNIVLKDKTKSFEDQLGAYKEGLNGAEHLTLGSKNLISAIKAITGEKPQSLEEFLPIAEVELAAAEIALLPLSLNAKNSNIISLANFTTQARELSKILPVLINSLSDNNYLVLLQDNNELTPAGGVVTAIALVSFEKGKLAPIKVMDPSVLNNYQGEADFKASSRGFITLFNQTDQTEVDGVVAIDLDAASDFLGNGLTLNEVSVAKQGSKEFPKEFTKELIEKVLYLLDSNFIETTSSFQKSVDRGHIQVFLKNPRLSNLNSSNFTETTTLKNEDFLAVIESNIGSNKANYFLDKSFGLEIVEGKHNLSINLTNRSPNEVWPGGSYMANVAIFTPLGSKLTSIKFGEEDLTLKVNTTVDYNKTVYGVNIKLLPKEAKSLNVTYQTNKFNILNVIKQAGSEDDPLVVTLPGGKVINTKLSENQKIDL